MEEVALKSIKCGRILKKQPNCVVVLPETSGPRLDFLCRGETNSEVDNFRLQCEYITAIDLRVEAKFGSIDAMEGTLLVECSVLETNSSDNPSPPTVSTISHKSCLVQAIFHVNETRAIRDLIRKLRNICLSSNLEQNTNVNPPTDQQNDPPIYPKPFKEGLPNWVQWVPHYIYSKRTRQWIQFAIYTYMVFSVMWAIWQLYRYVDFVREFVRPFINILQYQFRLLDYTIRIFNTLFEEYTIQWLCFIKPLYTVTCAMAAPLLQTVAQLSPVLRIITRSITNSYSVLWPIVKPIFSVGYQLGYLIFTVMKEFKTTLARFWHLFFDLSLSSVIGSYLRAIKYMLWALWQTLGQAQFDPLKAQLVIVRTTVINSSKAVGLGMLHLVRKIYKVIWLRRSARVEKQE